MPKVTPPLPGALSVRKVLTETTTYVASAVGTYRYLSHENVASGQESREDARGVQVIRTTEPDSEHVVVEVRLLTGTPSWPTQRVAAVLLDSPDEVQDFLEQYAPEVFATTEQWEAEWRAAAEVTLDGGRD